MVVSRVLLSDLTQCEVDNRRADLLATPQTSKLSRVVRSRSRMSIDLNPSACYKRQPIRPRSCFQAFVYRLLCLTNSQMIRTSPHHRANGAAKVLGVVRTQCSLPASRRALLRCERSRSKDHEKGSSSKTRPQTCFLMKRCFWSPAKIPLMIC